MNLCLVNHEYKYAIEQMMLTHYSTERPTYAAQEKIIKEGGAVSTLRKGASMLTATCKIYQQDKSFRGEARVRRVANWTDLERARAEQKILKLAFYRAAVAATGKPLPWGALSGIRPGKMLTGFLESGLTESAALHKLEREYHVSPGRAQMALDTAETSIRVKASLDIRDICLYVGIPFCPTRCTYCSFISSAVEKSKKIVAPYLDALAEEIKGVAAYVRDLGLRVVSVYIGGGTPTTLSPDRLDDLLTALSESFDFSALREYTVEAGRPDTVTAEKLGVLLNHGVGRVSINPQSMQDGVLNAIGRAHTAADIETAMALARGRFLINMDLIAGLPTDTEAGFSASLERTMALEPQNITIHTLALKKGARLMLEDAPVPGGDVVAKMLDFAGTRLLDAGFHPYYLYRQKYTSGGFENVGWCKVGMESLYNVCMMEELRTVIALGAGGSTKLITHKGGKIRRIFNPKYPYEYIDARKSLTEEKSALRRFYEEEVF